VGNESYNTFSDKDARMAESFSDTAEATEKKGKKKKKKLLDLPIGAFESTNVTEKPDKDAKPKTKDVLDDLFPAEQKKPPEAEKSDADLEISDILDDTEDLDSLESLGDLSVAELEEFAPQIIEAEEQGLQQELVRVAEGSPQETEILTAASFLELAKEKQAAGQDLGESLQAAKEEIMQELGIDAAEGEAVPEEDVDMQELAEQVVAEALEDDDTEPGIPTIPTVPTAGAPLPLMPIRPVAHTSMASPLHGAGAPPAGTPIGPVIGGSNFGPSFGPNALPPTPNVVAPKAPEVSEKNNPVGNILLGGFLGYLVGRRHGRIKAQEKMMPIQKSLEKKLKEVQAEVVVKTTEVRKATAEHIATKGELEQARIIQKVEAKIQNRAEQQAAARPAAEVAAERSAATPAERVVAAPERTAAPSRPEAARPQLPRLERLGSVIVPAPEAVPATRTSPEKAVAVMPERELLQVASKIEVGGVTAKVLYEQGRLEKQDLQLVVQEYVRGSSRFERVLIDKLHPPRASETGERLAGPGGSQTQPGGGGSPTGGGMAYQSPAQFQQQPSQPVDAALGAADNRLAQDMLEHKQPSKTPVWAGITVLIVVVVLLAVLLF